MMPALARMAWLHECDARWAAAVRDYPTLIGDDSPEFRYKMWRSEGILGNFQLTTDQARRNRRSQARSDWILRLSRKKRVSPRMQRIVKERCGHRCFYCGAPGPGFTGRRSVTGEWTTWTLMPAVDILEIDHVVPVSRGGRSTLRNLVAACYSCNRGKSDLLVEEWMPEFDLEFRLHELG